MTAEGFIRVPRKILTLGLSSEAQLLYGLLLERHSLSSQNGHSWKDKVGVFIYFTREAMAKALSKSIPTVRKALRALCSAGLLRDVRQGLTKANKLYLTNVLPENKTEGTVSSNQKPCFIPDRKPFAPTYKEPKKDIKKGVTLHREGEIYEKNGELFVFKNGYSQRHYTTERLNDLFEPI